LAITGGCRRLGVEVHHLVIAGHTLQASWSLEHPVPVSSVVEIATELRRHGSGRELPRLVVQTVLGECDFGLTGIPIRRNDDGVAFRMLAVAADEWPRSDPSFELPSAVELDEDDRPVVPVPGLRP
ncbi:MAG: lysine 2,3-aminomutase, partial [Candidatus Sulfomarinibacteraceae bacterium]